MIDHHQMAVDTGNVAQSRAQHPQIKSTADNIVRTPTAEMNDLADLKDDGAGTGSAGREMDDGSWSRWTTTAPHHQGAIRMAPVELAKCNDPRLKAVARGIVAAQTKEIRQMDTWRTDWYGEPSPAGGVLAA